MPALTVRTAWAMLPALLSLGAQDARTPFRTEAAFLRLVALGQGDPHLELHLSQYATDPRWGLDWDAERSFRSGFFGAYGSTTSSRLLAHSDLVLNLFPTEGLQFRYERRNQADDRFETRDERVSFLWSLGPKSAFLLTGCPEHRKAEATVGLGFRWGEPQGPSLEAVVVNEGAFWNEKTEGKARYRRRPLRLRVDGAWREGPWRLSGSLDLGSRWEMEAEGGWAQGHHRQGRVAVEHQGSPWVLRGQVLWASRALFQGGEGTAALGLNRHYGRIQVMGSRPLGRATLHLQGALSRQRDDFDAPTARQGAYALDSRLLGLEVGWPLGGAWELRPGYLGHHHTMDRQARTTGEALDLLPALAREAWADKAHLRLLREGRNLAVEFLLSQTVGGSRFGGGSVKLWVRF